MKYGLTNETKTINEVILYRIKALKAFADVKEGDLGGWIEKGSNLSQDGDAWVYGNARVFGNARVSGNALVYGNARVSGNALVYGNACLSAKANFTKGRFIGGDDSMKITNITTQTGTDIWKAQYVLGDYEITPIEEEKSVEQSLSGTTVEVKIGGKTYSAIIQ